jgi:peptide/nickel transport system substrate-binding protein
MIDLSRRAVLGGTAALATVPLLGTAAHAADTPRKGGTLKLGLAGGSTTDTLDFTLTTDSVGVAVNFALYSGLVENGPDNKVIPELAESYEAKPGAAVWILNLRKGVTFSNGKEFTADDAVYSLNMHRGAGNKSGAAGSMKEVSDVKKLDTHQIQITLAAGDADLPATLTDYHIMMVPDGFKDFAHPIGTGAFTLASFDPGVRIAFKHNANYWKPNRGHLDAVEITVINDSAARLSALLSGQVDAINRVDPKTVALIKKKPKLAIVRAPGGWFADMPMMLDRKPYDNPDLRKAMKLAIDREAVLKTLFSGYGTLGNDHPIPAGDPFHNGELKQAKYDPDHAKALFKKAGVSDKIVLQASDAAFSGAVDMATLFQANAAKAGIPMDVKKEPADGFWDNVWLKGSFVTSYWGGRPAATQMLAVAFASDAVWNETHWKVPGFDALLSTARAELDETKRRAAIYEMQAMLHNDGGMIVPAFRDWLDAHSQKVGGHTPHSGFDMDNGRICEKAWIKA